MPAAANIIQLITQWGQKLSFVWPADFSHELLQPGKTGPVGAFQLQQAG